MFFLFNLFLIRSVSLLLSIAFQIRLTKRASDILKASKINSLVPYDYSRDASSLIIIDSNY